jgi:hypothetical protein
MSTSPHQHLSYEPLPEPDDDYTIVRRCLREFAKDEQQRGEIPPEVSEEELYAEIEQHVASFVATLRRSALYPHLKSSGHTEEHIRFLIQSRFG